MPPNHASLWWLAALALCRLPASGHPLHDSDEQGRPITAYDAKVKPPAVPETPAVSAAPAPAAVFAPFAPAVATHWDERFFYVESDGMPDHPLMVGIRAWQQQVPIPQSYRGDNAWRFPLHPVPAREPVSARTHFFRGAIAIAANGVPIFNPIKNDGRTDTFLAGELDEYGGHAGRADDYHYHVAPIHLQRAVGEGRPVAYALDGYPIYGLDCPERGPPLGLDALNGHTTPTLGYHYHATRGYPYLNGGFHGEVVEKDGQVDPQPRARGVRPATAPLRGARITGFARDGATYQVRYDLNGRTQTVNYHPSGPGWVFEFVSADATTRTENFPGGAGGGRGATSPDEPKRDVVRREPGPTPAPSSTGVRIPWIVVHAAEMDANHDGRLTRPEVEAEIRQTFQAYDHHSAGRILRTDLSSGETVRSALGGFVRQHAAEIDADGNGALTVEELRTVVLRMYDRALASGRGDLPAQGAGTPPVHGETR